MALQRGENPLTFRNERIRTLFNRNTLEGILSSFTKISARLDVYAAQEQDRAQKATDEANNALKKQVEASANAFKARSISGKITSLIS